MSHLHDDTICLLGEGPLWHPERQQLFWFDILGRTLHIRGHHWRFDNHVSAAGWIDYDRLLIATADSFIIFNIPDGSHEWLCPLEADNPVTRSNDGRADPYGGFWIGTMGLRAEDNAGAIYRYYRGEVRQLYAGITIPNAICFAPDGETAFFADSTEKRIMRVRLDAKGWPKGEPEVFIDMGSAEHSPDGAVIDAAGNLWNAQWGAGRVACYGPDGVLRDTMHFDAVQTTCPAFGGPELETLYCTTAAAGLSQAHLVEHPDTGRTLSAKTTTRGQAEHRVIL